MTSPSEPDSVVPWTRIVLRGLLYALLITLLVLYAPTEKAEFIYLSF